MTKRIVALGLLSVTLLAASVASADGTLRSLRVDERGKISGIILADGTEFVTAASDRSALRSTFQQGDHIRVVPRGPGEYTVSNARAAIPARSPHGPARGGGPSTAFTPWSEAQELPSFALRGSVDLVLRSPEGATVGVVMADGAQVHFPLGIAPTLQRGDRVHVHGYGTRTSMGTGVLAARIHR